MKLSWLKIFAVFGVLARWTEEALSPDTDEKIRITSEELVDLGYALVKALGIDVIIEED